MCFFIIIGVNTCTLKLTTKLFFCTFTRKYQALKNVKKKGLLPTASAFNVLLAHTNACVGVALRRTVVGTRFVASAGLAALDGELIVVRSADIALVSCHSWLAGAPALGIALQATGSCVDEEKRYKDDDVF